MIGYCTNDYKNICSYKISKNYYSYKNRSLLPLKLYVFILTRFEKMFSHIILHYRFTSE